jgi:hypothetical protein
MIQRGIVNKRMAQEAESLETNEPAQQQVPIKVELNNYACWTAVARYLQHMGKMSQEEYIKFDTELGPVKPRAKRVLVSDADTEVQDPTSIPEGAAVGFYRGAGETFDLAHVMYSLGGGRCTGTNNGCIGGGGTWAEHDLAAMFSWTGTNPTRLNEGATQHWKVYYRQH